jgi:hypothetical protein
LARAGRRASWLCLRRFRLLAGQDLEELAERADDLLQRFGISVEVGRRGSCEMDRLIGGALDDLGLQDRDARALDLLARVLGDAALEWQHLDRRLRALNGSDRPLPGAHWRRLEAGW